VKLRYTRHQVARGAKPDAEVGAKLYLLKRVPVLHATYQVRMLAFRAQQEGKILVLRVPRTFEPGPSLCDLMTDLKGIIRIERSDK
jgi:hypothetical protein